MRFRSSIFAAVALTSIAAQLQAQAVTLTCAATDSLVTNRAKTAAVCIAKGTSVVVPPVIPPIVTPPAGASNEPSGMTKLTETAFNCVSGCGEWAWYEPSYTGAATMVSDNTAPCSPPSAVSQNYKPALPGGSSPGTFTTDNLVQKQTLYVSICMQLSLNYQGHPSGVNKVLHFFTKSGRNVLVFNVRGTGSGTLVPAYLTQGMSLPYQGQGTEVNFDASPATCTTVRGKWHKYEMLIGNNSPGVYDGTLTLWMDGKKCLDVVGLGFVGTGQSNKWDTVRWSPTWGGVGSFPSSTFAEIVDHIYISGR